MLEKFIYTNHINESIEFGSGGLFVNENDLRNFTWDLSTKNGKITSFSRGVVSKTIPVVILSANAEDVKNRLFEVCEKDVLAKKHGKIFVGDYYLKCFVTASSKSNYLQSKKHTEISLKISTDFPYWVKETTTTFGYNIISGGKNLDFNNDFAYDYTSNMLDEELNNTGFAPANFRMLIYGPVQNPVVNIGGYTYAVNASVAENEYLAIDSIAKTVILKHKDGSETNCFNLRNRESYLFQKIHSGINLVSITGDFKFDITLLEERSEPKWI